MPRFFRDWNRSAAGTDPAARARRLQPQLNAFVAFCPEAAAVAGPLAGLTYAAKDLFSAPDRVPRGGLRDPLPAMDCAYADALRLSIALPVAFDDRGLPVALQLVGRPNSDRALLTLASAIESGTDWHGRVPHAVLATVLETNRGDVVKSGREDA
jgi:Asp-tRNA(Asn)/Glu-tRNA(Gln) amidotransferase A subunit family amidase